MKYAGLLFLLITYNAVNATVVKRYTLRPATIMGRDTDSLVRKRSLSAGISYGSDALFFGRTGPITYPFMSTDVVYNTKNGFFVYGSALKLLGYPTLEDEVDLGAGYSYRFKHDLKGSISYNRFIFSNDERIIESATSNDINWKNTYNWKT